MKDINASLAADLLAAEIKYDKLVTQLRNLPRFSETSWEHKGFLGRKDHSFSMENDPLGSWHMRGDIEDLLK